MGGVRDALVNLQLSSLFVIDGYKRTLELNIDVALADKVLFSSYHHWYLLAGFWVDWPYDNDQRPDWSDMKSRYGSKFSMSWINTKEVSEYDDLFGHAKNLGLNGVWIYGSTDHGVPVPHYNDEWYNISYAAWHQGFLRQFKRKYYYYYHCLEPDPCNNCDDPDAQWVLDHITRTEEIQEFYP